MSRTTCEPERGIMVLQLAMTIGVFMFMLAMLLDLSLWMFRSSALVHALFASARQVIVTGHSSAAERVAFTKAELLKRAQIYSLPLTEADIRVCPLADPDCSIEAIGASGDFFILRGTVRPSIFFLKNISFQSSITMRNE